MQLSFVHFCCGRILVVVGRQAQAERPRLREDSATAQVELLRILSITNASASNGRWNVQPSWDGIVLLVGPPLQIDVVICLMLLYMSI